MPPRSSSRAKSVARRRVRSRHAAASSNALVEAPAVGKRVAFDAETWQAVDLLARDSMKSFQELADEAFADLLAKHGRPDTLRQALRDSASPHRRRRASQRRIVNPGQMRHD